MRSLLLFRIMQRRLFVGVLLSLALVLTQIASADARPRPSRRSAKQFQANKGFGLGLMLGVPSGLSGKYYLSSDTALDFGVGAYYRYRYEEAFSLHADFLWHPFVLAAARPFWIPLYVGIGGRLLQHRRDDIYDDHSHLGVRFPLGIAFDFNNVPLDIFLEFALVIDFIQGSSRHNLFGGINSAIGFRYYFN